MNYNALWWLQSKEKQTIGNPLQDTVIQVNALQSMQQLNWTIAL